MNESRTLNSFYLAILAKIENLYKKISTLNLPKRFTIVSTARLEVKLIRKRILKLTN